LAGSRALSDIPGIEAAIIQVDGASSQLLLASIYVHPEPPKDSIRRLLLFAETHGIILAGEVNSKRFFNAQGDISNAAGREVDRFLLSRTATSPSFPEKPAFIRISALKAIHTRPFGTVSRRRDF